MRELVRALLDIGDEFLVRAVLAAVRWLPGRPGNMLTEPLKRGLLTLIAISVGRGSQVSPGFFVFRRGKLQVGAGCRLGYNFQVWNFTPLTIGDRLLASHGIKIICGNHKVSGQREDVPGPVQIGNDVWLGADLTIVGPCVIGHDVIVGANSYVTGHLRPGWIYAGNPAKPIRPVAPASVAHEDVAIS